MLGVGGKKRIKNSSLETMQTYKSFSAVRTNVCFKNKQQAQIYYWMRRLVFVDDVALFIDVRNVLCFTLTSSLGVNNRLASSLHLQPHICV